MSAIIANVLAEFRFSFEQVEQVARLVREDALARCAAELVVGEVTYELAIGADPAGGTSGTFGQLPPAVDGGRAAVEVGPPHQHRVRRRWQLPLGGVDRLRVARHRAGARAAHG